MSENQRLSISEHLQMRIMLQSIDYKKLSEEEIEALYPKNIKRMYITNYIEDIYKRFIIYEWVDYKKAYDLDKKADLRNESLIKNIKST